MRRKAAFIVCTIMIMAMLTACGKKNEPNDNTQTPITGQTNDSITPAGDNNTAGKGRVYYLNFKPEVAEHWENIGKQYTAETGVAFKVVTAASGTYESTLKSEVAKTEAPTIFQINGPVGYKAWRDYCADLSGTKLYDWLLDKSIAISEGEGVYGIPFAVEGYGIIYNQKIMNDYFALPGAVAAGTAEINNFDQLKKVVTDMTARKAELGIEGVFASTSFSTGEDWRWQTHLANLPVYYEYRDEGVTDKDSISFKYSDKFKNIFDLYINNSITAPTLLSTKNVNDSMAEFALGQVAMVQNGNWAWGQISDVDGNVVEESDIKFLPIYTGMEGEETQGLCTGTENFICINKKASADDQAAAIAFLEWLYSSDSGKNFVVKDLGFITPFSTFNENEKPDDPLAREVIRYMEDDTLTSVSWNFTTFPNQTFKDNFGASLLSYCQGQKEWQAVVDDMVSSWSSEKASEQ